jgi:NhaP-type Na+/H+ or K+/H+ antiporter
LRKLKGHVRKVVIRLIVIGVLITSVLAASVAAPLLGMSRGTAVMLGIIFVVSGPTVVGQLSLLRRRAHRRSARQRRTASGARHPVPSVRGRPAHCRHSV